MTPQERYRRNLPHIQPPNSVLAITIRLFNSLPKRIIPILRARLNRRKEKAATAVSKYYNDPLSRQHYFVTYDNYLDKAKDGPMWLARPDVAQTVIDALMYFDEQRYKIICYAIMGNHIHFIFHKLDRKLSQTLQNFKSYSAQKANILIGNTGKRFWARESYDHYIRNREEFVRQVCYVMNNPVKAGIVRDWWEYKYSYIRDEYRWTVENL